MTGRDVSLWADRLDASQHLAASTGATIVSKGQPTAVVSPDGRTRITGYDTKRFARMGYGDVLAGTISAFLSLDTQAADAVINALLAGNADAEHVDDPYIPS
jgi:NAD(P)H-hydrate epimerase